MSFICGLLRMATITRASAEFESVQDELPRTNKELVEAREFPAKDGSEFLARLTITAIVLSVVLVGGCSRHSGNQPQGQAATSGVDHRNAEYLLEGQRIRLADGLAESENAPGSASRIVTRYFANELRTDLNDDGREDVVFLITQQRGGSGTLFYAVAALNTKAGYVGSDGYLLGDRIAPETPMVSRTPGHKNVITVAYRGRRPDEPMTAPPSVSKSVYLKLNAETVRWGVVVPGFERESR
jgi:hypothetical protein